MLGMHVPKCASVRGALLSDGGSRMTSLGRSRKTSLGRCLPVKERLLIWQVRNTLLAANTSSFSCKTSCLLSVGWCVFEGKWFLLGMGRTAKSRFVCVSPEVTKISPKDYALIQLMEDLMPELKIGLVVKLSTPPKS